VMLSRRRLKKVKIFKFLPPGAAYSIQKILLIFIIMICDVCCDMCDKVIPSCLTLISCPSRHESQSSDEQHEQLVTVQTLNIFDTDDCHAP